MVKPAHIKRDRSRALIADYKQSPEWDGLRPASRADYQIYLGKIDALWGDLIAADLSAKAVYEARDAMRETPVAANHFVSVLRTVLVWGIPRGYTQSNVARDVKPIKVDADGARPWPEEAYRFVLARAPTDIRRMAILGRATGQRRADLVRMRPIDRHENGMNLEISKLRNRPHWVPLTKQAIAEIDGWNVEPMQQYLVSSAGKRYSPDHLNSRWNRWRARPEAKPLRELDISIHDLRAMAVCDRRIDGLEHQEIASQLCMSLQMVMRYSKHVDDRAIQRRGLAKQELGENRIVND